MLVLKRKRGEAIKIGDATITVTKAGKVVTLSIDAPKGVNVARTELPKRKHVQDRVATPEGESGQQEANTHDA